MGSREWQRSDGGASAHGGSIPPLPTTLTTIMNLTKIIAYVRGTTEYEALTEQQKMAVGKGEIEILAKVLNTRIEALDRTDPTKALSVREVLSALNDSQAK